MSGCVIHIRLIENWNTMEFLKLNWLLSILLFYTYFSVTAAMECEDPSQLYVIRSVPVGLVLDVRNSPAVEMHPFTGSTEQLWHFERSNQIGASYIISEHTGEVLDISNAAHNNIELSPLDESNDDQLWYINRDGTIGNGGYGDWNLDILENNQEAGTPLVVYPASGLSQQIFTLQEKS